jgi:hypothetical protein
MDKADIQSSPARPRAFHLIHSLAPTIDDARIERTTVIEMIVGYSEESFTSGVAFRTQPIVPLW